MAVNRRLVILEGMVLGIILLLAAYLRLNHIDQAEFLWDQAEISKWALRMTRLGEIAWVGPPSSTSLHSFFGATWLLAIPYALSPSPIVATAFVASLNVLAVLGCYLLARRWFGRLAAATAALLFTVSPWAVIYSRKIWQVEFFAPFAVLHAWTGWLAFVQQRRWALPLQFLAAAWLVNIHFAGVTFVALTALWTLLFWRRIDWRMLLLGAALAGLLFVPYVLFNARHDWVDLRLLRQMMGQPAVVDGQSLWAGWIMVTAGELRLLTGPDRYAEFIAGAPNLRWLFVLEGVLAFGAALLALGQAVRQARRGLDDETAAALLAATGFLMPILFFARHVVPNAPHYFTSILPAPFILVAWLFSCLYRPSRGGILSRGYPFLLQSTQRTMKFFRVLRDLCGRTMKRTRILTLALGACILLIAASQTYETVALQRFVWSHDTLLGYDTPIAYDIRAAQTARRLRAELGGEEVILLSEGDEPRVYEMPATAGILFFGEPHRAVDIRAALVFPSAPAIYWSTYEMTYGETLLAELAPELVAERVWLREGARAYRFYHWPGGAPNIPGLQPLAEPVAWANGARLVGYRLEGELRPGSTIRWTLAWQPERTPTEDVNYHWFNHLLDGGGEMIAQADGPSMVPAFWRSGDTVLNWFDIAIPSAARPGDYTMRVGMYVYPAIENVAVVDEAGRPAGEWVRIGPLSVAP